MSENTLRGPIEARSPVARATRKARVLDQDGAVVASARIASRTSAGISWSVKARVERREAVRVEKSFVSALSVMRPG